MTEKTLRRYTGLVAAIQILRSRALTLLSPSLWDDKNDAYSLDRYRLAIGAKRVLALCFAEHYETYHHWKIYAPGAEGVCIEFDKQRLLDAFQKQVTSFTAEQSLRNGNALYLTVSGLKAKPITVEKLPFIKRFPYGSEEEFRFVYTDNETALYKEFEIDLACITRINLSPWMPGALDNSIRETIRSISGFQGAINRSRLVDYENWKACVRRAHPLQTD